MSIFDKDYFKLNHEVINEKIEIASKVNSSVKNGISKIKAYKSIKDKSEANKIKELLTDAKSFIYAKKFEDIKDDTYGIIEVIRPVALGVFASILFSPLLGIITLIVDKIIKDKVTTDDVKKIKSKLSKEIQELRDSGDDTAISKADRLDKQVEKLDAYLMNINDDDMEDDELNESSNINLANIVAYDSILENDQSLKILSTRLNEGSYPMNECILDHTLEFIEESLATKKAASKVAQTDKKISGKIDRRFNKIIGYLKKSLIGATKEEVVRGSIPKLSSVIKIAMLAGTAAFIAPVISIIGAIIAFLIKKKLTEKEKKKIILDLKNELEICEEKIKDADSDGAKDKKYQLMRLRAALKKDIDRIKYSK